MRAGKKITFKRVALFAGAGLATGLLFAAGYDLYRWLKGKATGATVSGVSLGAYIPEPTVVTYDNRWLRRYQ